MLPIAIGSADDGTPGSGVGKGTVSLCTSGCVRLGAC